MISFVNAKINIGLNIVRRRPDGYHDLSTIFYPVGLYAGTPTNPVSFSDVLEIIESDKEEFIFMGRRVDCPPEKNLVVKAYHSFFKELGKSYPHKVILDKHLPDGAGLGGGSADASFTLRLLNELMGKPFSDEKLESIALSLGADCPFFIKNTPCYAEGVGERMEKISLNLEGKWILVIKPDVYVSTKEAFAGVTPKKPLYDLRQVIRQPIEEWKNFITNDFEDSLFPRYPQLQEIKELLYDIGASFALMSGSGSSLYGIFTTPPSIPVLPPSASHYLLRC